MAKQKATAVKLWKAIMRSSRGRNVLIDYTYEKGTDKISVTVQDRLTSKAITEKYLFDDLSSMSQLQLEAVISDLIRVVEQGGVFNLF